MLGEDVVEILDLEPADAGLQQRDRRVADIGRPVCHAADEEAAEDEVEGVGAEARVGGRELFDVALDVFGVGGVKWEGRGGSADGRDGGEIDAVDVGCGRVGGGEGVSDCAGAAADVEEALGVAEGGVDDMVVHEVCEGGGLGFEAGVFGGTGGVRWRGQDVWTAVLTRFGGGIRFRCCGKIFGP